jgi:hypothetical protein
LFAEIIAKVSNLVTAAPEIVELDLNPLLGTFRKNSCGGCVDLYREGLRFLIVSIILNSGGF